MQTRFSVVASVIKYCDTLGVRKVRIRHASGRPRKPLISPASTASNKFEHKTFYTQKGVLNHRDILYLFAP